MQEPSRRFPAIEVAHLTKRVADATGELMILQDVNFTVQAGGTLAIVGASGSGKSTLLGLLAGLDTPTEGTVKLNGTDIFALDEDGRAGLRKTQLGFVFQSFQLLAHLNALENVMLPLELRNDVAAKEKAESMLSRVGLSTRLKHYPKYLSGGEQQRVALARAGRPLRSPSLCRDGRERLRQKRDRTQAGAAAWPRLY